VPTLPTNLVPKGANVPNGWPFDSFEMFFDPQPTAYPSGIVSSGVMQSAICITLTSAQLLALQTTAVQLVNAPGTPPKGFGSAIILVPTSMLLQYKFGGTAYTIAGTTPLFQVEYTGQTTSLISASPTGLVDQAVNTLVNVGAPAAAGNLAQTVSAGLGLEIKLGGTTPSLTLGNGTLVVNLQFDVLILQ